MTDERDLSSWTLTEWEWLGLEKSSNLADGHAHGNLDVDQLTALGDLTSLFIAAEERSQIHYERRFIESFLRLAGQTIDPSVFVRLHYSSSLSIESVAKALAKTGRNRVALPSPTFDNIPLLLARHGLELVPYPDSFWQWPTEEIIEILQEVQAIFVVAPNNPTGIAPSQGELERLFRLAARCSVLVVVDFSFRFFSGMTTWDQYLQARSVAGLDYIFIEDTGKTWPAREIKVGICVATSTHSALLEAISNEVMLNVSPFALSLLTRLVEADENAPASGGHLVRAASIVAENRRHLRARLENLPLKLMEPASTISVEWLGLPTGWAADSLCLWLDDRGVTILPGAPFYWSSPEKGNRLVRLALMRHPAVFRRTMKILETLVLDYDRGGRRK